MPPMPWTSPMEQRMKLIADWRGGELSVTQLCAGLGISRKTAYKWRARYDELGPKGLEDRSSAPLTHPQSIAPELAQRLLDTRAKWPTWGPRKLRARLLLESPDLCVPAASSIGDL